MSARFHRWRHTPGEPAVAPLDEHLVRRLLAVREHPCVSVLMSTAAGGRPGRRDAQRLDRLVGAAARRLLAETDPEIAESLIDRLDGLVAALATLPSREGVALFASPDLAVATRLPVSVSDRVAVDPSFATRDLVRALALRPRYRMVTVSDGAVRLLEGSVGALEEVPLGEVLAGDPEPTPIDRGDRGRRFGKERESERQRRRHERLRRVAALVAARRSVEPLPLVVAGVARRVADWHAVAGDDPSCIGSVPGNHDGTPPARLDALARPVVDAHLRAERAAALAELLETPPARSAFGVDAVWDAVRDGLDLLCVEEGFVYPARPTDDGRRLTPADVLDGAEVLDDAVDEIIEMVRLGDGRVVMVRDGALAGCGRIAARVA